MKQTSQKPALSSVECVDGLEECILTARTLAGLLDASGDHPRTEGLAPEMVSRAGYLIWVEMNKAEALLEQLGEAQREGKE